MKRLPIVLSAAAFVIALMGVTPLGQATRDALPFAKNADRVDTLHASRPPKAGQLYPLGANKKFPAEGPLGDEGAEGRTRRHGAHGTHRAAWLAGSNRTAGSDRPQHDARE
jgi:hypothetical protein